ncbi:MAG: LamG domain-containing protein [Kiritimatiellae bacterium]|nr:LamG domain-containing protein [Kiritimatiellia bacterium]
MKVIFRAFVAIAFVLEWGDCARAGSPTQQPSEFGGTNYVPNWLQFEKSFLHANMDSLGNVTVSTGDHIHKKFAVLKFGLKDQNRRDFWESAEIRTLTATRDERALTDGKTGKALKLDGYPIDIGASPKYNLTSTMSISAWIKPETWDGGFILSHGFTKGPNFLGEDHLYSLRIWSGGGANALWFEMTDADGITHDYRSGDIKIVAGQWQHVAATYDGSVLRTFINGKAVGAGKVAKGIKLRDKFVNGRPMLFGDLYRGAMDEVRLYDRALNENEIKSLADIAPDRPAECDLGKGLVGYWNFEDEKDDKLWNVICKNIIEIKGATSGGSNVVMTVKVSIEGDAVTCEYESGTPMELRGTFPAVPEVNWFKSEDASGKEVQGELWGEYKELKLFNCVDYTCLNRRDRLSFGSGAPIVLEPCGYGCEPATFSLASTKVGDKHKIRFAFHSLNPADAPLADPKSPVVTKPFNRNKLCVLSRTTGVDFTARKGGPAVFKLAEKLAFTMTLSDAEQKRLSGKPLEIRCVYAMNDSVVQTIPLNEFKGASCDVNIDPVRQGPYRLELWSAGKMAGETEFAVAGPVEQRRIGPLDKDIFKLREVDRIECAAANDKGRYYSVSPANDKIVEAPGIGKFLMNDAPLTGAGVGHEWVSYRINNLNLDKPHLLVVEYPDVGDSLVGITFLSDFYLPPDLPKDGNGKRIITPEALHKYTLEIGKTPNSNSRTGPPLVSGFITGNGLPITGKKQSVSAVFYPGDDWGLVHFDNYGYMRSSPIRLCRIVVYEILDDIPMLEASNLSNDRIFGHYTESYQMVQTFSFTPMAAACGEMRQYGWIQPGRYYKWYFQAAERMVKYMRFRGENTLFAGVIRYAGAQYDSKYVKSGLRDIDLTALYARVFEANDLTLVPSVAYVTTFPLRLRDRYTDYDVATRGADTILQVSGDGYLSYTLFGWGRAVNPLHPKVRKEMAGLAAEIAERYKDYPAVKGVMYISSANTGAWLPSYFGPHLYVKPGPGFNYENVNFYSTYDDYTVAAFEKRAGIRVPIGKDDPGRFPKRRAWLLQNQKQAWTEFRCQGIADNWAAMGKAVKEAAPHMNMYAAEGEQTPAQVYVYEKKYGSYLDVLEESGAGVAAHEQSGACVIGYSFNEMFGHRLGATCKYSPDDLVRFNGINLDDSVVPLLDRTENMGVYMERQFTEHEAKMFPSERPWYATAAGHCRYPLAGNRGSMLDYAVIMSRCTPLYISHYWVDGGVPQGHDEQFREFAAAYRTIPLGKYRTVFTEGYPGVTVRSAVADGTTYFYVVNTDSKPRTASIASGGELREHTLARDRLTQADGRWSVRLEPYAIRVFASDKGTIGDVQVRNE